MGFAFVACSHDTVYDENFAQNERAAQYEQAFIKAFGAVSPNETWDFSGRGSELAAARTRTKPGSDYLTDWRGTESYGYVWNYPEKSAVKDPMPEKEVNSLFNNYWTSVIVPAINSAQVTNWNPTGKIVFRALATSRTEESKSKYFALGMEDKDGVDLYLRLSSPDNAAGAKRGTTVDQHTSSLDFSQITGTHTWYTCSTTGQNKNKISINASNYKLTNFKEVTVNINDKDYTFWCFKCDANGGYTDLVLWVNKVPTVPVLVDCKRYFVEDLGGSDDFDFNDIVFDVALFSDGRQTCYVRALGGTLDITIRVGGGSWTKSDHYTKTEMINTIGNINYDANYGEFDASGWDRINSNVTVEVEGADGQKYGLPFPRTGEIPYIIAVMDGKHWRAERDTIEDTDWFTAPNE